MRRIALLAAVLLAPAIVRAEDNPDRGKAVEERLRQDVTFLASDRCEGRGPGTEGIEKAGQHVAAEFKKSGLRPGGPEGSYFQPFTIPSAFLDEPARLTLVRQNEDKSRPIPQLRQGVDFWPLGLGDAGQADAPVVFAGYGITSKGADYDDYAGIDVEGKVVIVLRGFPQPKDRDKRHELFAGAPFLAKIENARKHGAVALLVVNDQDNARNNDELLPFSYTALEHHPGKLPTLHARRSLLETMLPGGAEALREIEKSISRTLQPRSQKLDWKAKVGVKMHRGKLELKNVVGVLPGSGPLADETIVVGAHYDHLGYGSASSLAKSKAPAIHHGADDNGSGTTMLMELARRFGAMKERQGRRLVFIAFSGEELGLFGSEHYCKHPLFPLESTAAMYNMDMVGRLRPDKDSRKDKILTEGSGTAAVFPALVERLAKKYDLQTVNKKSGFGPSDHASFCKKKVPVLFLWTGNHPDYHRPTDTADKINLAGMRLLADFSTEAVTSLATLAKKPEFVVVKEKALPRPAAGPTLGILPSYSDEGDGLLIDAVREGRPADRAGLKAEDRIVELAGKPVTNIETYMSILAGQRNGDTIEVGILRKGKKMTLKVKLD
jgi:hypothetical protein